MPFPLSHLQVTCSLFPEDNHPHPPAIPVPLKQGELSLSETGEKGKAVGKSWLTPLATEGLSHGAGLSSAGVHPMLGKENGSAGRGNLPLPWKHAPSQGEKWLAGGRPTMRPTKPILLTPNSHFLSIVKYLPQDRHLAKHFKLPESSHQLCKIGILIQIL